MGLILLVIAFVFTAVLTAVYLPLTIVFHIVALKFKKGLKRVNKYFRQMALAIDQFANVSLQTPLDILMRRPGSGHKFGDEDDTVSYVIAMNDKSGTLSLFGRFWGWFLNKVDKNHLQKAIENKRLRDIQALKRLNIQL